MDNEEGNNSCSSTANSNKIQRHQSETTVEKEVRKSCSCKKANCLQIYCECFHAGVYCEGCHCRTCLNEPTQEEFVLETRNRIKSRNPHAFTRKFDGPRCKCKKTKCQQDNCGCYKIGIGCSVKCKCKCEECKNDYGRKNVSAPPAQKETADQSKEVDSEK